MKSETQHLRKKHWVLCVFEFVVRSRINLRTYSTTKPIHWYFKVSKKYHKKRNS